MQKQTKNSSRTWILLLVLALLLSLSGCQEEAHPGLSSQPPVASRTSDFGSVMT